MNFLKLNLYTENRIMFPLTIIIDWNCKKYLIEFCLDVYYKTIKFRNSCVLGGIYNL